VHGITSLTAWQANPADLLAGNRGHWEVENREHYVRDRTARAEGADGRAWARDQGPRVYPRRRHHRVPGRRPRR